MKINKQKSKKTSKKGLIGIILTIICIICMGFYLLVLWPAEDILTNEAETQNVPTVSEGVINSNSSISSDTTNNSSSDSTNSTSTEPTKTPGKTPAQYEGETPDDEPAYNNEQFRIPEEE